jgi:ABC-type Fe3+/spermidine/putrescine transport system ATPase subunit
MALIKNLKYSVGNFSLSIPELNLADDAVTAITGPSGSGKTTFFKLLLGLLDAKEEWSWQLNQQNLVEMPIEKKNIGVVFQSYELFPHMTAEENITLIMRSRHNQTPEAIEQLNHFKEKLNLQDCWQTLASKLSGGEQQRVSLLRAILSKPRVLLLDEPFSALDAHLKQQSYEIVKQVLSELKLPIYMITHNMDEAAYFTDKIVKFNNGRIV